MFRILSQLAWFDFVLFKLIYCYNIRQAFSYEGEAHVFYYPFFFFCPWIFVITLVPFFQVQEEGLNGIEVMKREIMKWEKESEKYIQSKDNQWLQNWNQRCSHLLSNSDYLPSSILDGTTALLLLTLYFTYQVPRPSSTTLTSDNLYPSPSTANYSQEFEHL